ncbi:hypothetical protein R4B61_00295 [Fructilactobacillus vespulae]|uniref:hypothetical protein n=1 Tax=Fructilactobacillus vespulae TaxID=1249630 RepID=UPI0039B3981E
MTVYKPWYITKMLSSSITSANVSNNKIVFKYMFGSNDVIDEKDYSGLTNDLINTITIDDKVNISSTYDTDGILTITSVFTNSNVTKEHKLNTIGIVAEYNGKEFLAAISSANTPYLMPVYSDNERVEYTIRAQLGVSNTSVVDLSLDPVSLVTNETVTKIKNETDRKINDNSTRVNKAQTSADNAQSRADDAWNRTDELFKKGVTKDDAYGYMKDLENKIDGKLYKQDTGWIKMNLVHPIVQADAGLWYRITNNILFVKGWITTKEDYNVGGSNEQINSETFNVKIDQGFTFVPNDGNGSPLVLVFSNDHLCFNWWQHIRAGYYRIDTSMPLE